MRKINLTYIIATKNKLPYLKKVISNLVKEKKVDEEVIVIDGNSTDGTKKYLRKLFFNKLIDNYLSEPDLGEAHAYNKALLIAKGTLIKIITDDDIFYYPGIQKCKKFMLTNANVDVIATEGFVTNMISNIIGNPSNGYIYFKKWKINKKPFSFCGLGLMIRKSSLSKTGLFNPGFFRTDMEFSMRISSYPVNIAWYKGLIFIRFTNPASNSFKDYFKINFEEIKLMNYYYYNPIKIVAKLFFIYFKSFLVLIFKNKLSKQFNKLNINQTYNNYRDFLYKYNINNRSSFIMFD